MGWIKNKSYKKENRGKGEEEIKDKNNIRKVVKIEGVFFLKGLIGFLIDLY